MKMSKIEGLQMLKILNFPTVELIDPCLLDENSSILRQGVSVRTSPKMDRKINVNLPSMHNCKDLKLLRDFVQKHKDEYNIVVHKTVKPEKIGSISRYGDPLYKEQLAFETFEDFEKRKNEIIENQVVVPIVGGRFMLSQLQMKDSDEENFKLFGKVFREVTHFPFKKFDAEFVLEKGRVIFTDLTIEGERGIDYLEEFRQKNEEKNNQQEELDK